MKCRDFDLYLAEWIVGRLPEGQAAEMQAHCDACTSCKRDAEDERVLRAAWQPLRSPAFLDRSAQPDVPNTPDLWPRLSARIAALQEESAPAPIRSGWTVPQWLRMPRFVMPVAMGGALATVAIGVMLLGRPVTPPGVVEPQSGPIENARMADENKVIQLVSDMQRMPDPDSEMAFASPPHYQRAEHLLDNEQ
jgi:hypothetical protein